MEDVDAGGKCAVNRVANASSTVIKFNEIIIFTSMLAKTLPGFGLSFFDAAKHRNLCAATSLRNLILPEWALVPPPRHSIGHPSHAILMQYGGMTLSADRR